MNGLAAGRLRLDRRKTDGMPCHHPFRTIWMITSRGQINLRRTERGCIRYIDVFYPNKQLLKPSGKTYE
ncbi:hypothetical protein NXC24_PB00393 (plasmid) [Rhizobium sp. NXC24]|nr:hypothetical protein NXC24_PB00393 [Rhizobium sp. NXC24]